MIQLSLYPLLIFYIMIVWISWLVFSIKRLKLNRIHNLYRWTFYSTIIGIYIVSYLICVTLQFDTDLAYGIEYFLNHIHWTLIESFADATIGMILGLIPGIILGYIGYLILTRKRWV